MKPKKAIMSREAFEAVSQAVDEDHSVFCLEQLGVTHRVINLLYDNGIKSIADLVSQQPEQILKIPNMGMSQLGTILDALSKYHKIEEA